MKTCPAAGRPPLRQIDGRGSIFRNVRAWQTDEPALDMTGAAIATGAAQLQGGPRRVPSSELHRCNDPDKEQDEQAELCQPGPARLGR